MQNIAIIFLLLICLAVLLALFRISYKMLIKVRKEERMMNLEKHTEYQLHPKIKNQKIPNKKSEG